MFMGLIPGIGAVLSLFHLAVLYALYSFEYKWIYQGKQTCLKHFSVCSQGMISWAYLKANNQVVFVTAFHANALVNVDDRKLC